MKSPLRTIVLCTVHVILSLSLLPLLRAQESNHESAPTVTPFLSENSVVLITGASTHLGSQLAITLHQTYNVSKLILIDDLHAHEIFLPSNTNPEHLTDQFLNPPPVEERIQSEKSLSSFEFKRQRMFHVMQTLGEKGHFYRVNFRPVLPEYSGTVTDAQTSNLGLPVLNMIFESFDVTHLVHLDPNINHVDKNAGYERKRVISRKREDDRMGMMEALLEQIKIHQERTSGERSTLPQFVYASTGDIYNYDDGPELKREDWDISFKSSSSLKGTAKLLDEILARSYSDLYGVSSIGLRLFEVYGPWSSPGTKIYELAERAISKENSILTMSESDMKAKSQTKEKEFDFYGAHDYVYIDDAIDAILSAMQLKLPSKSEDAPERGRSLIVNVGSGEGISEADIAMEMERHFPRSNNEHRTDYILERIRTHMFEDSSTDTKPEALSRIASTDRAKKLLGFEPQVSFEDGIIKTLAWHLDRAFPFGLDASISATSHSDEGETPMEIGHESSKVIHSGIRSCHPFDAECLNGFTAFPCISECSRSETCKPTIYDNIAQISKAITLSCEAVMYTIDMKKDVTSLSSDFANVSGEERPSVDGEFCNIAFVRDDSELMKLLRDGAHTGGRYGDDFENALLRKVMKGTKITKYDLYSFGIWTILPLSTATITGDASHAFFESLKMIPKLSPGLFFSSEYAVYCEPNVSFKNISALLQTFADGNERSRDSSTLMMLGTKPDDQLLYSTRDYSSVEDYVQERMYNTINLALKDSFGIQTNIDSSWMIHSLKSRDAKQLRCDVLGEMIGWKVSEDLQAMNFILSLHQFWSGALAQWRGQGFWWKSNGRARPHEENIAVFCGGKQRCLVKLLDNDYAGVAVVH